MGYSTNFFSLAKYLDDDSLYEFINFYIDEFHLAINGISLLQVDDIFPLFINELHDWITQECYKLSNQHTQI